MRMFNLPLEARRMSAENGVQRSRRSPRAPSPRRPKVALSRARLPHPSSPTPSPRTSHKNTKPSQCQPWRLSVHNAVCRRSAVSSSLGACKARPEASPLDSGGSSATHRDRRATPKPLGNPPCSLCSRPNRCRSRPSPPSSTNLSDSISNHSPLRPQPRNPSPPPLPGLRLGRPKRLRSPRPRQPLPPLPSSLRSTSRPDPSRPRSIRTLAWWAPSRGDPP